MEEMEKLREKVDPINDKGMIEPIRRLKLGKAAGRDKLMAEMIKYMREGATRELRDIMNEVIKRKVLLKDWIT